MVVVATNNAPGTLGQPITIQTNVFGIGMLDATEVFVYDITISYETQQGKIVEITKKGKMDYMVNNRKERAINVYKIILEDSPDFFGPKHACWYDGQSLLFSKKNFFAGEGSSFKHFSLLGSRVGGSLEEVLISFDVKAAARKSFIVDEESVTSLTANADLLLNDHSITQFLELALNQYAIMHPERHKVFENGKSFLCNPLEEGFTDKDIPQVGDGKRLLVGTKKSIRPIEGPAGRGYNNPALVVDAMKAAFHEEILLIEKAKAVTQDTMQHVVSDISLRKLSGCMKGLGVVTVYNNKPRMLEIHDISQHTAMTYSFDTDNGPVTLQQYYATKYNFPISYPNAPLAIIREKEGLFNLYPLEGLRTVPFTRVTIPQQTPEQSQKTTKECAIDPLSRKENIKKGVHSLQLLTQTNEYVINAGLKLFPRPLKCDARILPGVCLTYSGAVPTRSTSGKWRAGKYLVPASCTIWASYLISTRPAGDEALLKQFAEMFFNKIREKGMQWSEPAELKVIREVDVEGMIRQAACHGCKFVLIITPDTITSLHKKLKLWERELQMTIQDLKGSTFNNIVRNKKFLSMENIIHKTNMKLGGLNYGLDLTPFKQPGQNVNWITNDRLILGVSLSHPSPGARGDNMPPTVVGFSANFKSSPHEFVGDYVYQEGRKVLLSDVMPSILSNICELYRNNHNGTFKELVIYRAGVDEGLFSDIISEEVRVIKEFLDRMGIGRRLVYIVAQREQPMRFFRESIPPPPAKPADQNIPPGVVCDVQICHPTFKEFYLTSHTTIQGSTATPRYTVLVDDLNLSMNELEGMTFALAHGHQIITSTVSVPAPVYIANRYAERGAYMFTEYMALLDEPSKNALSKEYSRLNQDLAYNNTAFSNTRGKQAPPYMARGTLLAGKFKIEAMIAGGGFGQIFRATYQQRGIMVAVKVEPESEEAGRMVLEQKVLAKLAGKLNVPRILYAGSVDNFNFIVMQILGKSLTELKRATRCKRLQINTVVRVGVQMVQALRDLHEIGYLHRDVKPSNMCAGLGDHRRIIYLVDFGMTRQFRFTDGSLRRNRHYAAFRGTMRYVSVAVHMREEQTPRDDLISLFYTLIELGEGQLPWRTMTEADEIMHLKYKSSFKDLCTHWPQEFDQFLKTLERGDGVAPDYDKLTSVLKSCSHVSDDADFEWDEDQNSAET